MLVAARGDDLRVAEDLLDDLSVDALLEQQRGCRVPGGMQRHVGQAVRLEQLVPGDRVLARVQRPAVVAGPDQAGGDVGATPAFERIDERRCQRDDARALLRLRPRQDQA